MQKLQTKILKLEGWEILDLAESEFKSWDYDQRVQQVKGWLKAAKEKQISKGLIPKEEPKYV